MAEFVFTSEQAPGAILNGTVIEKVASEADDAHPDGSLGKVVGSLGPMDGTYAYFIEWDDMPGVPVGIASWKIRPS